MAISLRRQLSEDEKAIVLGHHGRVCFATAHAIPEEDTVHFDHIHAHSSGGPTELNNIAPMCSKHNQDKGTLPLFDFRAKLRLNEFFSRGDRLTLGHLLAFLRENDQIRSYGAPVFTSEHDDTIHIESAEFSNDYQIYICPVTGWKYFYANLPVAVLNSDDAQDQEIGLQPRYLLPDKVFNLFRHLQTNPVLQPALGRLSGGHIKLFDGQHKAAGVLWNGREELECKIYLDPQMRLLNQANIAAHDKFAQTRFFTSIMVMKLGSQFGADFAEYQELEDETPKSERGFIDYLIAKDSLTRGVANDRFRRFLFHTINEHEDNKVSKLVSASNRATEDKPITFNALERSLFAAFLYQEPVQDNMTSEQYVREKEAENVVNLLNMLHEKCLWQWNPRAGSGDENQKKLERILRARFMKAWSELLRDVTCAYLQLFDRDDQARVFYREVTLEQWDLIQKAIDRLVNWNGWIAPSGSDIDTIRMDTDRAVKEWLRDKGLTTGYLMGASV